MTAPTVSVILPAYNGTGVIADTLRSLAAQSFPDWEAVVVDDGSSDGTPDLLRAWPDRRVRLVMAESNGGPVLARNRAVAESRGRYVAALDQDDLCLPERFARQVAYLDAHPGMVLVGAAARVLREGELSSASHAPITTPRLIEWLLTIENPLVWSSVMLRTDAAKCLQPFTRPDRVYAEDFDLYHRLLPLGQLARLDEELVVYRQHAAGVSKTHAAIMRTNATAVLRDHYRSILDGEADGAAALIADHVMAQVPAPDRHTLARLGAALVTLQGHFLAVHDCTPLDRRLIRWETARRWGRITRSGLRTGRLGLGDAVAVRPDHLGLGYARVEQLIWSRLVGKAKTALRRA